MAAVQEVGGKKVLDVYDEEFAINMEIAKNLIERVEVPQDKQICKKWIAKLCSMRTTDVAVKRNRNSFFKYFLQVLHKGVEGDENLGFDERGMKVTKEERDFMCRWSEDKRTYIAAKPLPGQGTLVYMAVSKDPSLGWEKESETIYV